MIYKTSSKRRNEEQECFQGPKKQDKGLKTQGIIMFFFFYKVIKDIFLGPGWAPSLLSPNYMSMSKSLLKHTGSIQSIMIFTKYYNVVAKWQILTSFIRLSKNRE